MILNRLREADLQVDIQKCKFNVEETVFLEVIVSEQDLRMNSIKVKVIVNWTTLINLKKVQSFVKFVNFYRRFIKNFLKLVKSFTQLTRKNTFFCMKQSLCSSFWWFKETSQLNFSLMTFQFKMTDYSENQCIWLRQRWNTITVWWWKYFSLSSILQ